jgi:hypothetical protein
LLYRAVAQGTQIQVLNGMFGRKVGSVQSNQFKFKVQDKEKDTSTWHGLTLGANACLRVLVVNLKSTLPGKTRPDDPDPYATFGSSANFLPS